MRRLTFSFFSKFLPRPFPLWARLCLAAIIFFVLATSAFASYRYFSQRAYKNLGTAPSNIVFDANPTLNLGQVSDEDKKNLGVLLLGYGGAGHDGAYLTDVMQIAYFDFEKKQLTFVSIPRDLEVTFENGQTQKINSVINQGLSQKKDFVAAAQTAKSILSQITGLPIKYFVAIDFVGFQRAIGYELDGIDVQVSQTLDDPWYPIEGEQLNPCGHSPEEIAQLSAQYSGFDLEKQFTCRYEHLHYEPGIVHMEGGEALKYVRSRHSSSDFDRSRRQEEVLLAIRKKLFSFNALQNIPQYYQAFTQHLQTDVSLEIAQYLAPLFVDGENFTSKSINLSTENVLVSGKNSSGAFVLLPKMGNNNWQGVKDYIHQQL